MRHWKSGNECHVPGGGGNVCDALGQSGTASPVNNVNDVVDEAR